MKVFTVLDGQTARGSDGAAGWDLYAEEDVYIPALTATVVPTRLRVEIPRDSYCQICGRSGLASQGIFPIGGVIDSDYRGEIGVILVSLSGYQVNRGDKIAQMVQIQCVMPPSTGSGSERGDKGFGSTGR